MAYWLAFDIDSPSAGVDWLDYDAPPPNLIIQNTANGHAHYLLGLTAPVCTSVNGRTSPLRYLAHVEKGLTERYRADRGYAGLIVKNPVSPAWRVITPRIGLYDLKDLAEYCEEPANDPWVASREVRGYGRNVELFDRLRFWAYEHVENARNNGNFDTWAEAVLRHAEVLNAFSSPLLFSEIKATAKSVAKWTWQHYHGQHDGKNRGVMGFGETRRDSIEAVALTESEKQARQRAGAEYTAKAKRATREADIVKAVGRLRLDGKKPTAAAVARLTGIHRNTVTRYYRHLLS